ncbi:MAG: hypothetical protein ACYC91_02345 [Solirubrobacteraceae bacterium]
MEHFQGAGLRVAVDVVGSRRSLAPSLEVSGYRVVQEALTNTLKHAGPASALVLLCYDRDALEIGSPTTVSASREQTTVAARRATAWWECVSASRCSVGPSRRGRWPSAGFRVLARMLLDPVSK